MGHKISAVIPTAEQRDLLRQCLESLQHQSISDFEIILVSDGAGAQAGELAKEYRCTLIRMPTRRGFAAAVNRGVAAAHSEYVALLNDDVQLDRDWLRLTSAVLDERPDFAFCCGKIYRPDGITLDNAGDAIAIGGSAWRLGHGRKDSEAIDVPRTVFACPGTASLLRKSAFDKIGGLDEDFFAYLEDIDFSLRVARQGLRGLYLPQAKSWHWGGATSGGPESAFVFRYLTQNQLMILAKHYPWQLWLRFFPRIAWAQLLWAGMAIRKRRFGAYLAGIANFMRLLPSALRKRVPWRDDEIAEFIKRLRESEREIYADTSANGRSEKDTFWRLYFALFPPRQSHEASVKPGLGRLPVP
jgi:GT2 family glycosyltransferase